MTLAILLLSVKVTTTTRLRRYLRWNTASAGAATGLLALGTLIASELG